MQHREGDYLAKDRRAFQGEGKFRWQSYKISSSSNIHKQKGHKHRAVNFIIKQHGTAFYISLSGLFPEHNGFDNFGYGHHALRLTQVFSAFESPWEIMSWSSLQYATIWKACTNQKAETAINWLATGKLFKSNCWVLTGFFSINKGFMGGSFACFLLFICF